MSAVDAAISSSNNLPGAFLHLILELGTWAANIVTGVREDCITGVSFMHFLSY